MTADQAQGVGVLIFVVLLMLLMALVEDFWHDHDPKNRP